MIEGEPFLSAILELAPTSGPGGEVWKRAREKFPGNPKSAVEWVLQKYCVTHEETLGDGNTYLVKTLTYD